MWEWAGYELSILSQVLHIAPSDTNDSTVDFHEIVQNLEELGKVTSMEDKLCLSCQIHQVEISDQDCSIGYYSIHYRTNYNLDNQIAVMLQLTIANTPLNDECLV